MKSEVVTLEDKARRLGVPEHLVEGICAYVRDGRPTGSFLEAVISNDLSEACARADPESGYGLVALVRFLSNCAPIACWGREGKYDTWVKKGADKRRKEVES